jgi:hypothetical protein
MAIFDIPIPFLCATKLGYLFSMNKLKLNLVNLKDDFCNFSFWAKYYFLKPKFPGIKLFY